MKSQKLSQMPLKWILSHFQIVHGIGKILEQERIEIIKTGFQLQAALKKYY